MFERLDNNTYGNVRIVTITGKTNTEKSSSLRCAIVDLTQNYGFDVIYNSKKYANDKDELVSYMQII